MFLEEVASEDLGFKLKSSSDGTAIFDSVIDFTEVGNEHLDLLAIGNQSGYIALSNIQSVKLDKLSKLHGDDVPSLTTLAVADGSKVTQIGFNSDESRLVMINNGTLQSVEVGQTTVTDYLELSDVQSFAFSPNNPTTLALISDGKLYISKKQNIELVAENVSAYAWGIDGLHYTKNGSFDVYGLTGSVGITAEALEDVTDEFTPVFLRQLKPGKWFVVYQNEDDLKSFVIEGSGSEISISTTDLAPPYGGAERKATYYTTTLANWLPDTVLQFITGSLATDVNVISLDQDSTTSVLQSEDTDRAQFPIDDETGDDASPIGLAIDTTTSGLTVAEPCIGVDQAIGKLPILYTLLHTGKLLSWWVFDKNGLLNDNLLLNSSLPLPLQDKFADELEEDSDAIIDKLNIGSSRELTPSDSLFDKQDSNGGYNPFGPSSGDPFLSKVKPAVASQFNKAGAFDLSDKKTDSLQSSKQEPSGFGGAKVGAFGTSASSTGPVSFGSTEATDSGFGKNSFGNAPGFGSSGFGSSGFGGSAFGSSGFGSKATDGSKLQSGFAAFSGSKESPFGSTANKASPFASTTNKESPFGTVAKKESPFGTVAKKESPFGSVAKKESPFAATNNDSPFSKLSNKDSSFGSTANKESPFAKLSTEQSPFASATNKESSFASTSNKESPFASLSKGNESKPTTLFGGNSKSDGTTTNTQPSLFGAQKEDEKPTEKQQGVLFPPKETSSNSKVDPLKSINDATSSFSFGAPKSVESKADTKAVDTTTTHPETSTSGLFAAKKNAFSLNFGSKELKLPESASDFASGETSALSDEEDEEDEEDEGDEGDEEDEEDEDEDEGEEEEEDDENDDDVIDEFDQVFDKEDAEEEGEEEEVEEKEEYVIVERPQEVTKRVLPKFDSLLKFDGYEPPIKAHHDKILYQIAQIYHETQGNLKILNANTARLVKVIHAHEQVEPKQLEDLEHEDEWTLSEVGSLREFAAATQTTVDDLTKTIKEKEDTTVDIMLRLTSSLEDKEIIDKLVAQLNTLQNYGNSATFKNRPLDIRQSTMQNNLRSKLQKARRLRDDLVTKMMPLKANLSVNGIVMNFERIIYQLDNGIREQGDKIDELAKQFGELDVQQDERVSVSIKTNSKWLLSKSITPQTRKIEI